MVESTAATFSRYESDEEHDEVIEITSDSEGLKIVQEI